MCVLYTHRSVGWPVRTDLRSIGPVCHLHMTQSSLWGGGGGGRGEQGAGEGAVCNITDLSSAMAVFSLASWRYSFPSILLSSFVQTVQLSGGGPNAVGVHMDVEIQLLTDLEF